MYTICICLCNMYTYCTPFPVFSVLICHETSFIFLHRCSLTRHGYHYSRYLCLCITLLYKSSLHYIKCIQFTPFVEWEVGNVENCHSVLVVRPYDLPRYTIAITERDNIAKFLYRY